MTPENIFRSKALLGALFDAENKIEQAKSADDVRLSGAVDDALATQDDRMRSDFRDAVRDALVKLWTMRLGGYREELETLGVDLSGLANRRKL